MFLVTHFGHTFCCIVFKITYYPSAISHYQVSKQNKAPKVRMLLKNGEFAMACIDRRPKINMFNHIEATSKVLWYWDHSQKFWAPALDGDLCFWNYGDNSMLWPVTFQMVKYKHGFFDIPQLVVNLSTLDLH